MKGFKGNMERRNCLCSLKKCMSLIYNFSKPYILIISLGTILESMFGPLSLVIMQHIVNALQIKNGTETIQFIIIYVSVDVISTLEQYIINYYKTQFSFNFNTKMREKVLLQASRIELKCYEDTEIHNIIQRAENEGETRIIAYIEKYFGIIGNIISSVSYIYIVMKFRLWMLPVILLIPISKFVISNIFNMKQYDLVKKRTTDERKAWYYKYLIIGGQHYKELKLYGLFEIFTKRHIELLNKFNLQNLDLIKRKFKLIFIFEIIEQIIVAVLFIYIVFQGITSRIMIGDVVTYMKTITSTKAHISSFLQGISNIKQEKLYIEMFFDFLEIDEKKEEGKIVINDIKNISVKKLYYKYSGKSEYILKNINIDINKNELVTIVGRNGSGKTTLIKILMSFYDDYEGTILINGIDLKNIDKQSYLNQISALFQDYARFEATIRENIAFGNLSILYFDEKIREILDEVDLTLIENKPYGLDMQLGYWFDDGKQISIGEWQKIALARAFSGKSSLFFLDEPNAALDPISDHKMDMIYDKILENSTGVIISHRFTNLAKKSDKIFVMDKGEIIEEGNHQTLLQKDGIYKELYEKLVGV